MQPLSPDNMLIFFCLIETLYLGVALARVWILRKRRQQDMRVETAFWASLILGNAWFWFEIYIAIKELGFKNEPPEKQAELLVARDLMVAYFAQTLIYVPLLWSVKFTFLAFYYTLSEQLVFRVRMFLYATVAFVTATFLINFIIVFTWCIPITGYLTAGPGTCSIMRDIRPSSVSFATNVSSDLCILLLGINVIRSLSLRRHEVWALGAVLAIGIFSIAASTIRFSLIYQSIISPTLSGSVLHQIEVWSYVELVMAMVAFCMPAFRVFLRQRSRRSHPRSSTESSGRTYSWRKRSFSRQIGISVTRSVDVTRDSQVELCDCANLGGSAKVDASGDTARLAAAESGYGMALKHSHSPPT